ncbi:MAG: S46 family peptidase [Tannerellaceae bacterium]
MKYFKSLWLAGAMALAAQGAYADEGMYLLNELNKKNLEQMKALGFTLPYDSLYSTTSPSVSDAVVIFGGGCTGIAVSDQGLIFTNHHCGYGAIQSKSSVEHDYLKDGFVSQSMEQEIPIEGLEVRFLKNTIDVTDRIMSEVKSTTDEFTRMTKADSVMTVISDSLSKKPFVQAEVYSYYANNKYYVQVYEVFKDVRMVFAPPSSVGKFGGDTDNWMWPRHTGDFSVFRVYADASNQPAEFSKDNKPYKPNYVPEVSLKGYEENDYAMTIGFPGSTQRYLSSWGVQQRIDDSNKPRIEVRGEKQDIWKEAMRADDATRIKYASKYAGSSNYWKNSIGMNKGLARLGVIERKQDIEKNFNTWVNADPARKELYGEVLPLLEKGYTGSDSLREAATYLSETMISGCELVRIARAVESLDDKQAKAQVLEDAQTVLTPIFKDYEPTLDKKTMVRMMELCAKRVPAQYQPEIFPSITKKYKGDFAKYVDHVFAKTKLTSLASIEKELSSKDGIKKLQKDPAVELSNSVMMAYYALQQDLAGYAYDIEKGERLFLAGLMQMYPDRIFYSDANFTMRLSYGSIKGYIPFDAAEYAYFTTSKGILEKQNPEDDEFFVQPEILELIRKENFGQYANKNGDLNIAFISNNDITGGNSGSPVFDGNGRLIGLAFDGNWEAMSGDIAFEPALQRTISVDIRYVLFMIDRWGKCPRLVNELKLYK